MPVGRRMRTMSDEPKGEYQPLPPLPPRKKVGRGKAEIPPLTGLIASRNFVRRAVAMARTPHEVMEAFFDDKKEAHSKDPDLKEIAEGTVTAGDVGDIAPVSTRNATLLWCTGGRHEIPDGVPVVFHGRAASLQVRLCFDQHWCLAHYAGDATPRAEHFQPCHHCARPCAVLRLHRYEPRAPWVRNSRQRRGGRRRRIFCGTLCEWRFYERHCKQRRADARAS